MKQSRMSSHCENDRSAHPCQSVTQRALTGRINTYPHQNDSDHCAMIQIRHNHIKYRFAKKKTENECTTVMLLM